MKTFAASNRAARSEATRGLVLLALFIAIILVMNFTPLGYLNLPIIKATLIHVPVIIGSVLLGPKKGAVLGLMFGLTSFFTNTTAPTLLSFAFSPLNPVPGTQQGSLWALAICFIPRLLVGIVPGLLYRGLRRFLKGQPGRTVALAIAGASGAIVNTGLVMPGIYFAFHDGFAYAKGIPSDAVVGAIMAIVFGNGIPETIVAVVLTAAICIPVMQVMKMDPGAPADKSAS